MRYFIGITVMLSLMIIVAACAKKEREDRAANVEGTIWALKQQNILVDQETGCQYIVIKGGDGSSGITPRLGTLCPTK